MSEHYATYRNFGTDVYAAVRRAAFGQDLGQNSWMPLEELDRFAASLALGPGVRLLDVACGAGGPAVELARRTGCAVVGVDLDPDAIAYASQAAAAAGLEERAAFVQADASGPLPLDPSSFDAVLCIDAITHLRDRPGVLREWVRLLRPGGLLSFTDPLVLTGRIDSDELADRLSIGYVLVTAPGEDERLLAQAGLTVLAVEDTTEALAQVARQRAQARDAHRGALVAAEGEAGFASRQRFFAISAALAAERRLSRFTYLAQKPGEPA